MKFTLIEKHVPQACVHLFVKAIEKRKGEVNWMNELRVLQHCMQSERNCYTSIYIDKEVQNVTKIPPSHKHNASTMNTHCRTQFTHFVTQKVIIRLAD